MPVVAYIARGDAGAQQVHAAQVLLYAYLRLPLEWAVRLGDEARRRYGYLDTAVFVLCVHAPAVQHLVRHLRDADYVFVRLRRQAEHIIQLHTVPAAGKGYRAGVQQVLLRDVFVYRVAQALAATLDGEGQAAFAHLLELLHKLDGEVVRAERRQGQADTAALAVFKHPVAQLRQLPVVAGAQRQERHVLISGVFQRLDALFYNCLRLFRAYRAVDMPCLTEAAATHAAAEQLHAHPVVYDLGGRHDRRGRVRRRVKVHDNALCHALRRAVLRGV